MPDFGGLLREITRDRFAQQGEIVGVVGGVVAGHVEPACVPDFDA